MPRLAPCVALAVLCVAAHSARAAFQIDQVYSNADGTIQFVVLRETGGQDGQQHFAGRTLTATHSGHTATLTFPADLGSDDTSRRSVLIATRGYVAAAKDYPAFGAVKPDYLMADRFVPTAGGTLDFAGTDTLSYVALPTDGIAALHRTGDPLADNHPQNFSGADATLPVTRVAVIEYYNAALDHYFISDLAADIDALDSGRLAGWVRTGQSFPVWPTSFGYLDSVCRYYIPPEHGNSHFFSASPAECADVGARVGTDANYSGYVLETGQAFFVALPFADGTCPTQWKPVYRLWNNRADSNHRYTTDAAIKAQMLAHGYVAEGTGADAVIMCSPSTG